MTCDGESLATEDWRGPTPGWAVFCRREGYFVYLPARRPSLQTFCSI